jgi:hypothetical protein
MLAARLLSARGAIGMKRLSAALALVVVSFLADPGPGAAQSSQVLPPAGIVPLHSTVDVSTLAVSSEFPGSGQVTLKSRPRLHPDPEGLAERKTRAAETVAPGVESGLSPSARSAAATIVGAFEGLTNNDNIAITQTSIVPSDANLGVGPAHIFQIVNIVGRITDKSGQNASNFSLRSFFQLDAGTDEFDPQVIYDATSGRWFAIYAQDLSTGAASGTSGVVLAVSASSDPTGAFCRYRLGNPTTETFDLDFPQLGVSADKIVVGYNAFSFGSPFFLGAGYYVVNKADLLACSASLHVVRSAPDPALLSPRPAQTLDGTATLFVPVHVSPPSSVLKVLAINGVPGQGPVTATPTQLPIRSWTLPPNAPQAGSSVLLNTGDESVLTTALQNSSLWLAGNEACTPLADTKARSCIRVIEVRTDSMTVRQDMTLATSGQYYYYPALRPDGAGNLHMIFNVSSSSDFAGLQVTGRLTDDPLNTLQAPALLRAGGGAQTTSSGRMGDYYGAALDPSDPSIVWVNGEYIRATALRDWGTFVGALQFPLAPPPPAPALSLGVRKEVGAGLLFTTGETLQVDVTWSNSGSPFVGDVFFAMLWPSSAGPALGCPNGDPVQFFVNDLTASIVTCVSAPPQSFPAVIHNVTFPTSAVPLTLANFFSLVWPATMPAGTYVVAILVTPPGAFADGVVNPSDLIVLATASVTFSP